MFPFWEQKREDQIGNHISSNLFPTPRSSQTQVSLLGSVAEEPQIPLFVIRTMTNCRETPSNLANEAVSQIPKAILAATLFWKKCSLSTFFSSSLGKERWYIWTFDGNNLVSQIMKHMKSVGENDAIKILKHSAQPTFSKERVDAF